jgi:AcrR family transcriptional regulator
MEYNHKQLAILQAAETLFASQGFHGTSVRDIAHAADVNIAMISYYFGSKEKLIEAIFLNRIVGWKSVLESFLKDESLTFVARFDKLVETYVHRIFTNPCFNLMMMRAQLQSDLGVNDLVHQNKKEIFELISSFITNGQGNGVFNEGIDIPMMVQTLVGTTNHVMSTRHHFAKITGLEHLSDDQLQEHLVIHISNHLKKLLKAILIHEA